MSRIIENERLKEYSYRGNLGWGICTKGGMALREFIYSWGILICYIYNHAYDCFTTTKRMYVHWGGGYNLSVL